jgi:hypothetical protein
MPITHTDGQTYYSSAEVEGTVKDRLKTLGDKLADSDAKYKAVEPQLAELSTTKAERDALRAQLGKAEGGLKRFQAAASIGITDNDTLWALEQAHERAMANVPEAQRAAFETWLPQLKADPNLAPSYLRPVFAVAAGAGAAVGAGANNAAATAGAGAAAGAGAGSGGAGAASAGGAAAAGAGGAAAGAGGQRPAWAPAVTGQQPTPGGSPDIASRIRAATSLDDLAKLQAERTARR